MPVTTVLSTALTTALLGRQSRGTPIEDLLHPKPSSAPDLFSNDYLSLSTDSLLRDAFLNRISQTPLLFGSTGSRLLNGNKSVHIDFELRMKKFFGSPAALLCNSGYEANTAFFSAIPQSSDVIVFDEHIHASVRDGMATSRARGALYPFAHNSTSSFRQTLERAVQNHPGVMLGKATVFVAVESLYSMDGDFCPLLDIVATAKELVPDVSRHIVVDEAHTTGICGKEGRGLVSLLGLEDDVHTVLHTFGKARAFLGAVILTSPVIRHYLINYGRPVIYSTSLPYSNIIALDACFDFMSTPAGDELSQRLQFNARYFEENLRKALTSISPGLLTLPQQKNAGIPEDLHSPIFPILTPGSESLATYLNSLGYAARLIPYPVVPKGQERVRVVVHAGNTTEDLDTFISRVMEWASSVQGYSGTDRILTTQSDDALMPAMTQPTAINVTM
ncbi:aminotransferase [Stereum hirsutum FP-91666 SS1]|uniref:aminotransferase n=1 Tax=Stereum hirsutum (strain FP-91666) TaxID=721885 RepID=UPI000440C114|nr:aminotransferase [Stereum hirsutum FP-91666 SS1]EIM91635.1 aminotransferase [Stereum hirsutum FP-91666 SS1]